MILRFMAYICLTKLYGFDLFLEYGVLRCTTRILQEVYRYIFYVACLAVQLKGYYV